MHASSRQSQPQLRAQQAAARKPHDSSDDEATDVVDEFEASLDPEERQRLEQENSHLYSELNMLVGEVQLVEQQITEISRLEGVLSTHLREQAEVIEQLYDDAVGATMSTLEGNQNLQQATKNSSTNRKFVLIFLILASLSLLFLDMYN